MKLRLALLSITLTGLAACGGTQPPIATPPPLPELPTLIVQPEKAPRERVWDGVVEAVNQATLSVAVPSRVSRSTERRTTSPRLGSGATLAVPTSSTRSRRTSPVTLSKTISRA